MFKDTLTALKLKTPIGTKLIARALEEESKDVKAELMCMCLEVQAFEKHICNYCKAHGHKHSACPLSARLRAKFRGDREVNKIRGKKSVLIRRGARKTLRVISKRKYKSKK